jgi:hypothetical protein
MARGSSVKADGNDVARAPRMNIKAKTTGLNRISLNEGYVGLSI